MMDDKLLKHLKESWGTLSNRWEPMTEDDQDIWVISVSDDRVGSDGIPIKGAFLGGSGWYSDGHSSGYNSVRDESTKDIKNVRQFNSKEEAIEQAKMLRKSRTFIGPIRVFPLEKAIARLNK